MSVTLAPESRRHTILIIDDTPANLAVVVDYLEDHGFEVAVAQNGLVGIQRVKLVKPALILLDVMMPEIDGFETCRRLKADDTVKDIPVIFMTALGETTDKVAGFDAGGVDYITKPFQTEELLARVKSHLFLHEMQLQLAAQNLLLQQEITVRREAESALRLRNRAVESCLNAIVILDCSRIGNPIEYVNPAFVRITGYKVEDALGKTIDFLFGQDRTQQGIADTRELLQERREGRLTLRNFRKDGTIFWNDLHIAPVRDEKGEVTHIVCVMNDITEAKNYQEELKRQGNYDALTGLPNRNLLFDRLCQSVVMARRADYSVGVVFIDLDRFKFINDSLGHSAGDELLLIVSQRLRQAVRQSDTVARLSGDEFVLILPDSENASPICTLTERPTELAASYTPIKTVLDRVVNAVAEPVMLKGKEFSVTCSIGVSFFPDDGQDAETLLKNADAAMYQVKESGRNNFQFYTADMNVYIAEQLAMEASLRYALERNEFFLCYQPKVDLKSGRVTGVEALIRWNSREKGVIPPLAFIPILERIGMINDVGKWVIQQSMHEQSHWQEAGLPVPRIAVNVSQIQLDNKKFVDDIKVLLEKFNGQQPPLDLEITESLMMKNADVNIPKLSAIREMGIGIAIDDFGTGYSSLSQLGSLPINVLKIDRLFIKNITTSANDRSIVFTVISLAHSLKLRVVAEGVETAAQMTLLMSLGCDEVQGYYFSKPLPIEQYLEWQKEFSFSPSDLLKPQT
ncbi:MAG: EAL domain-containing protein [Pseudomonadota bacterium]